MDGELLWSSTFSAPRRTQHLQQLRGPARRSPGPSGFRPDPPAYCGENQREGAWPLVPWWWDTLWFSLWLVKPLKIMRKMGQPGGSIWTDQSPSSTFLRMLILPITPFHLTSRSPGRVSIFWAPQTVPHPFARPWCWRGWRKWRWSCPG